MYVAPPELWIFGAVASYKYLAPTERKAGAHNRRDSLERTVNFFRFAYEPSESIFRCRHRRQLWAAADDESDWRPALTG